MSDAPKTDQIDAPPATLQFRTSGQAGYSSLPADAAPAIKPPRVETHRTDNCQFRPAGC